MASPPGFDRELFPGELAYARLHRRRFQLSLAAMAPWPTGKHADIGAFTLHTAAAMARRGHNVAAVDLPFLAQGADTRDVYTARLASGPIRFLPYHDHDPTRLPFADGEMDSLCCLETLEHLPVNHWRVAAQWHRVLRPGGRILVSVPNVLRLTRTLSILAGRGYPPTLDEMRAAPFDSSIHFREYRRGELRRLLEESGFRVLRLGAVYTMPLAAQGSGSATVKRALQPLAGLWPFGGDTLMAEAVRE